MVVLAVTLHECATVMTTCTRAIGGTPRLLIAKFRTKVEVDIYRWYISAMSDIAKIFRHGRSQAVRLPLAYRLPGHKARVRRDGETVVLEPIISDVDAWFDAIDRAAQGKFMEEGRNQPPMPDPKALFD